MIDRESLYVGMMKCAIFAYLPPPRNPWYPNEFLFNLRKHPPKNDLVLYSDEEWGSEAVKTTSVTNVTSNVVSTNNTVFLYGVRLACRMGIDWMLYLESDCRVKGKNWDDAIFSEFFGSKDYADTGFTPPDLDMGGTMVLFRKDMTGWFYDGSMKFVLPGSDPMSKYIPSYGCTDKIDDKCEANCAFPNGAIGVYRVSTLSDIWGVGADTTDEYIKSIAKNRKAWDWHHGEVLVRAYQGKVFDRFKQIKCIYSSCGNIRTTEKDRQSLLLSGRVRAVHQIKSAWTI